VSKVITYVHDKLQSQAQTTAVGSENRATNEQAGEERKSHDSVGSQNSQGLNDATVRAGEKYEILCNEQVLNTAATLAAVRQYIWRNAGELVMHYRVKET
jgi:hypothetical protein